MSIFRYNIKDIMQFLCVRSRYTMEKYGLNQLREMIHILQRPTLATKPQGSVEEEHAAHNTQVILQREQTIQYAMKQFSHYLSILKYIFFKFSVVVPAPFSRSAPITPSHAEG